MDPGSPAAKQYALPLNQAREIGRGGAGSAAGTSPSLFGAGIGSARSHRTSVVAEGAGSNARGGARSGSREKPHRSSREGSPSGQASPASLDASHLDIAAQAGSGDGSLLALLGGGVAVLLLGGVGGVATRRARRSSSSQ